MIAKLKGSPLLAVVILYNGLAGGDDGTLPIGVILEEQQQQQQQLQ